LRQRQARVATAQMESRQGWIISTEAHAADAFARGEDVIEQWLQDFADEPHCGWPPPEPLGDHRWRGLLGGKPPSWWKKLNWKKEKIKCDLPSPTAKSRADVRELSPR
jgi:hypothetical protein